MARKRMVLTADNVLMREDALSRKSQSTGSVLLEAALREIAAGNLEGEDFEQFYARAVSVAKNALKPNRAIDGK